MVDRIGIIGFGRMGRAIAGGLVKSGVDPTSIVVYDKDDGALQHARAVGLKTASSNAEAVLNSDLIIIAVKPSDVVKVIDGISPVAEGRVVISIAALVPYNTIKRRLPKSSVYRAMPNIAVEVNHGFTALTPHGERDSDVEKLFKSLGDVVWVDEDTLDLLTLLSASTPALMVEIADALILASLKAGVPYTIARKAVSSLFKGVGELLSHKSVSDIRDSVITPRGVTIGLIEKLYILNAKSKLLEALSKSIEEYTTALSEARDKYK